MRAAADRRPPEVEEITYRQAFHDAFQEAMKDDQSVILMGEGVVAGGTYNLLVGLVEEYGPERVIDTPISELGFTGIGIGAAISGLRPVVYHSTAEFLYLSTDQMFNQACKLRYMSGGQFSIPILIIAGMGSQGYGVHHSSTNAAMFINHPGIRVITPSSPRDVKGLIKAALRDPNPKLLLDHAKLHETTGPVPIKDYVVPIGEAEVKREGEDVTLVAYSYMVQRALNVAETLGNRGISVEVLDLRTLSPMDRKAIIASTSKTGRLVVVDEGWAAAGVSAEVIAIASEGALDSLKRAPVRVNSKPVPIPFSRVLERDVTPSEERIIAGVQQALGDK